eukprot:2373150-Pleurochrysis_carterae.AAC.2
MQLAPMPCVGMPGSVGRGPARALTVFPRSGCWAGRCCAVRCLAVAALLMPPSKRRAGYG